MVVEARGRRLVAAVNALADAAGLTPGMTLADARAVFPALETVPSDPPGDAATLARIARWCGRYSPWTAVDGSFTPEAPAGSTTYGTGAAWLDVTGASHLFGGEDALAADLTSRLEDTGYDARAAIAGTPGAAWAAARFVSDETIAGQWTIVAPGAERETLAALPVAALRLNPATVARLEAVGLRHIADLMALPRAALAARFGATPTLRLDQALGRIAEPLSPDAPVAPHFARLAFAEPIGQTADLTAAAGTLATDLAAGLERAGRGARRLIMAFHEPAGGVHRLAAGTSRASRDPGHLARLFDDRLAEIEAEFGIEVMTLAAPVTETLDAAEADLGGVATSVPTGAATLIDRLSNRLGGARVVRFAARESHLPERAVRIRAALDGHPPGDAAWPVGPRPLRLLARPEAVEATAPVPDDPPVMFRWRHVVHRIVRADGPERIGPEWWRAPEHADGTHLRDYYRVEDTAGRRFWLYREGLYRADAAPAWFVHGIFE